MIRFEGTEKWIKALEFEDRITKETKTSNTSNQNKTTKLTYLLNIFFRIFESRRKKYIRKLVLRTVHGLKWKERLKIISPSIDPYELSEIIISWSVSGNSPSYLKSKIKPLVNNDSKTAELITNTECTFLATQKQMDSFWALGDLAEGLQIHGTGDHLTRPSHAARNGTVYYKKPQKGQKSIKDAPQPPIDEDGSYQVGCRCYLTPFIEEQ